ncbi:hypothetical protein E4T56_gene18852 [Termitomyces sp. T112]|nr:hypothetical protein E4T56_gene18852 [Termitomyces sp. T112]
MFFGLTNRPATFQTMMNNIFQNFIVEGVVCVYLNDILIYTKTLEEHCQITCLDLKCLHQHQLYLKPEKAAEMDPVKVAGVAEWPETQNKKKDFLHYAHLLFDLIGKDVMWSWGPPEQMAFDTLKHTVTSGPALLFPDDNSPFYIEANSSDFATGIVLSQQSLEDRKWHLVAFYSKSLNAVEQNYEIHNKEMLAIIRLFEEWQHFLEGAWHKFKVWMDHKNPEYFQTGKKLHCQQAQWSLYLANFDFSLHHKPGQSMGKPDALSWRMDHGMEKGDNSNIVLLRPKLFAIQAIEGLTIDKAEADILQDI